MSKTSKARILPALQKLCEQHGILTSYQDMHGRSRHADPQIVVCLLKAMGVPIERPSDAARVLTEIARPKSVFTSKRRAFTPSLKRKSWGVFAPLYALHSRRSWGAGDLHDWKLLIDWVHRRGGHAVASLPWLAGLLPEVSPYRPSSHLFWNEFYLSVFDVPELRHCPDVIRLMVSGAFQRDLASFKKKPRVDYAGVHALKEKVLRRLSHFFWSTTSVRRERCEKFVEAKPHLLAYARFCAHRSDRRKVVAETRQHLCDISEADHDTRYHLYVQWLMHEQLARLKRHADKKGVGLFLDLPLGVHPEGFDAHAFRVLFVPHVSVGAPPDPYFPGGQNWGFAPLNPHRLFEPDGRDYLRDCLQHHMQFAHFLRIDHVMRGHRQFWIPEGADTRDGVYVRYPAEHWYDLYCEASRRFRVVLVGEDLGMVPPNVRPAMRRHGWLRTCILSGEESIPLESIVALNTHDMPPFAATSPAKGSEALRSALIRLSKSRAWMKLVTLEDLWGEKRPQNIPGTGAKQHNWQRKMRYSFEEFSCMPEVGEFLRIFNK